MKEGGFKSRQQSDWENIIFRDWMLPSLPACAAVSIVVLASSPHNASPLSADRRDDLVDREAGRGQSSEAHRTTQAPGWASKLNDIFHLFQSSGSSGNIQLKHEKTIGKDKWTILAFIVSV